MIKQPKVSIVIPVYNGANYLREAIDSALAQTYQNIEVIVVNDGSNDEGETERIALSYGDKIRYFSKPNGGVASALNRAIAEMTGEYFSWLSHDDLYYRDKVSSQVQELSCIENMENVILYGNFAVFFGDAVGNLKEVTLPSIPSEQFRYFITTNNSLHGCTLLVPKQAFLECGMFNEALQTTQDYDLWFRMAERYRFVHMPQLLVKARAHVGQGSVAMKDTALYEINEMLSKFVLNLTDTDLIQATNKKPEIAYAYITENLMLRGFLKSACIARKLALENLWKNSIWDGLRALGVLLRTRIITVPFVRMRNVLAILRNKVRACSI